MNNFAVTTPNSKLLQSRIPPLQALMQAWEAEPAEDLADESETELMVMLSGMPGQSFSHLDLE